MKTACFYGIGDIRVEEVPVPEIGDNEVLVKVRACTVCGTDNRIYRHGHFKIPPGTKRVLGHEMAGEIAKVGAAVEGYRVGDRVALPPNVGCGRCYMCIRGYNQLCPGYEAFGVSMDGGFAEYVKVPAFAVGKLIVLQPWVFMDLHSYLGLNTVLSEPALLRLDGRSSMPHHTITIDVGEDKPRQIVSGLRKFIPLEQMQGARVLVLGTHSFLSALLLD